MTYVKSWRITLAGLKGISRSFSELSVQFKIVSISAAIKCDQFCMSSLTFNVEFITVSQS